MTLQTKIYIGAGVFALLIVLAAGLSVWVTDHRIAVAEKAVETAKAKAAAQEKAAIEKEREADEYKAKTEYLEQQLAEMQAIARKQDEEIKKMETNVAARRGNADRARGIRAVSTTADELCGKLSEVGHPC